jgi:hypothetical protein
MRVVESDQAPAVGSVQGERILEAMRALASRGDAPNPEPDAVILVEPVSSPVERKKELQGMIRVPSLHIISSYDMNIRNAVNLSNSIE